MGLKGEGVRGTGVPGISLAFACRWRKIWTDRTRGGQICHFNGHFYGLEELSGSHSAYP